MESDFDGLEPVDFGDTRRCRPDISRAEERLDWRPRTSLADGLARTFAWFGDELSGEAARAHDHDPGGLRVGAV